MIEYEHELAAALRYLHARINCATVEAVERINNRIYRDRRALGLNNEGYRGQFGRNLALKCNYINSLAIVLQYQRERIDYNPNFNKGEKR